MAEAVIGGVVNTLVSLITTGALKDEVKALWGVEDEISRLARVLGEIEGLVRVAEEMQFPDQSVMDWLKNLRDAAYKAEDIIDQFSDKLLLKLAATDDDEEDQPLALTKKKMSRFIFPFLSLHQFYSLHVSGWWSIKKIREDLDLLARHGGQMGLKRKRIGIGMENICLWPQKQPRAAFRNVIASFSSSSSSSEEEIVYGRDIDKHNIIKILLSQQQQQHQQSCCAGGGGVIHTKEPPLSVLALMGMGGVGKTTLAKLVYNEVEKFDLKFWLCTSEGFDTRRLTQSMIESTTSNTSKLLSDEMDSVHHRLQELLRGKRFLLVLDDVWNEDVHKLDEFILTLRECGASASKIVVTTRSVLVAHALNVRDSYVLRGLSDDDTWLLFHRVAFADGEAKEFPELVRIGKEIAHNCRGVSLAAKAIGGLLNSNKDESYWSHIRDNGIRASPLRLGYDLLPSHLKQCFLYLSLFPEDHKIDAQDLILQWLAHGFIRPSRGRPLEDIGREYLNDLLKRSFFSDFTKDDYGVIRQCRMHDLYHDLASSIARDEYLITRSTTIDTCDSMLVRHLRILGEPSNSFHKLTNLRTLSFADHIQISSKSLNQIFSRMKNLRVLNLSTAKDLELPDSISNLVHLRYLQLGSVRNGLLPNSISNLRILQSLSIGCGLRQLPKDINRLKRLRHLMFTPCLGLECMPPQFRLLTSLQTLSEFVVTKDKGCRIDELGGLDLGGKLNIRKLENVNLGVEAKQAKLIDKERLQELFLVWSSDATAKNAELVLEGLQPHYNLKYLTISDYPGNRFSSWLMEYRLPNLVTLELTNCKRCLCVPLLLQFPFLRYVKTKGMTAVTCIQFSIKECPSFTRLDLSYMDNLEELLQFDDDDQTVLHLRELYISYCPRLTSLALVSSLRLEILSISNCPSLTSLPSVYSLRSLTLERCDIGTLVSVRRLASLSSLRILDFMELRCVPEGMLRNHCFLERLDISNCPNLNLGELNILASLNYLQLSMCKKVDYLPQWVQNLTCLEKLVLGDLGDGFTCLPEWIGNLTALRSLKLVGLKNVACLPVGLLCLPLQHLKIKRCPKLNERYNRSTGIDRDQIEQIPDVTIVG